jgi:hypothetical protein
MDLHGKYVSNILYDFETRASTKLFRVAAIQFVRSYSASRFSCWEATCEPVFRDSSTGLFHVPAEVKVPGSQVTLTHVLQGYCVAEYRNGIDADPTYLPWVISTSAISNRVSYLGTASRINPPRRTCQPRRPCQPNAALNHAVDNDPVLQMILKNDRTN